MELKNAEKCHFSEYFFSTSHVIKVEGNTQKPIYWLCSAPKNLKKTQMAPNNMGNTLCITVVRHIFVHIIFVALVFESNYFMFKVYISRGNLHQHKALYMQISIGLF